MEFSEHRKSLGLTLAETARQLGLSAKSVGWLSDIENGKRDASLRLALRIERWSGGRVPAASVCREFESHGHTMAPAPDPGAEKSVAVFSPAEDAA